MLLQIGSIAREVQLAGMAKPNRIFRDKAHQDSREAVSIKELINWSRA